MTGMGKLINTLKGNLKWIVGVFFIIYFLSMFVCPFSINFSYSDLMQTWHKWQSFNVGVLAFLSSYYFYLGVKEREKSHRRSHYLANASIITHEFALINNYLRENVKWLDEQWDSLELGDKQAVSKTEKPEITETYLENFKNCMLYSESEERDYLSSLLFKLQMFKSRLDKTQSNIIEKEFSDAKFRIIRCIYDSIEIYSHIITNYDYFRQLETFNCDVFVIDIFDSSMDELKLQPNKYKHKCLNLDYLRNKYANKGESALLSKK
jgi:hypothetical protein